MGSGIAALARDDRRQHGERHHLFELALEQAEYRGRKKGSGEIDQEPVEAAPGDGPDIVRQLFVAGDAAERFQIFVGFLLDDIDDVVDCNDADQPVLGIDHGGCDQIVLAEHPRDFFLVVQHGDAAAVLIDQFGERHGPARAQQHVQRHCALPVVGGIDGIDFIKPLGQVGRIAHVVDRLPHRPLRRHRDELGLHPPSGGVFRIKQPALERDALRWRQLFEDLFLILFIERFEQFDGIVGFEFANTFGDRFRLELLEDFLANGVVDLVQRREVEIRAGHFDKAYTVLRF